MTATSMPQGTFSRSGMSVSQEESPGFSRGEDVNRNALRRASMLTPVLCFYQVLLYPVARPTAWALDAWLGGEAIRYFPERDLRRLIQLHMESKESDIARVEGQGALNFLELDDVPLDQEGELIDQESMLRLEFVGVRPVCPEIAPSPEDPFLRALNRSGKTWAVLLDQDDQPRLVLSTDDFIREAMFDPDRFNPLRHCHRRSWCTAAIPGWAN